MSKKLLLIISGYPATGKTTLGRKLSEYLKIPFLCKDDIKESLFDSLGCDDREWSKKLGQASFELLWQLTETMLKAETPLIIEAFFHREFARDKLLNFKKKYKYFPIEINCASEENIRLERFKERNETGDRHPRHVDHINYKNTSLNELKNKKSSLDIGGKFFNLDTTNFNKVDYNKLFSSIKLETNEK
ncbi:MAG: AAA family ATPase [bacterium]